MIQKLTEKCTGLVFLGRFWFVHILSTYMINLLYLEKNPVAHLSLSVIPCLLLVFGASLLLSLIIWWTVLSCYIIYTCYPVANLKCLLWHYYIWNNSMLLLKDIQFLSWGFPFLAMDISLRYHHYYFVQSAGPVEYTDCSSAEG